MKLHCASAASVVGCFLRLLVVKCKSLCWRRHQRMPQTLKLPLVECTLADKPPSPADWQSIPVCETRSSSPYDGEDFCQHQEETTWTVDSIEKTLQESFKPLTILFESFVRCWYPGFGLEMQCSPFPKSTALNWNSLHCRVENVANSRLF